MTSRGFRTAIALGLTLALGSSAFAQAGKRSDDAARNRATFALAVTIWESGDVARLADVIGDHYVGHTAAGDRDLAGLRARITAFRAGLREPHLTIIDQLSDGDRLATRLRAEGRDAATGAPVIMIGLNISRFEHGRIVEEWPVWERVPAAK
jgi:predicted SnoaL-like aldol condensation-catalyzing enzyme